MTFTTPDSQAIAQAELKTIQMKKQIVVASALALFVCSNFSTHAQAHPITAPQCKDIPSCGVAGIVIGTEIVGRVL